MCFRVLFDHALEGSSADHWKTHWAGLPNVGSFLNLCIYAI